jgi:DNA-binding MarR family transcriptional regulator
MEDFMNLVSRAAEGENLEGEIFSCLRRVINAVEIYSSKLKDKTGLNASQLSCLVVLKKGGPMSPGQLSRKVFLSPSMITSIIDQLEKKELVLRNRDSTDRRVILIQLTESGKGVVKTTPPSFQDQLINCLSHLKKEEKKNLVESLNKLFSIIVSEVLIDSSLLEGEDRLVEVEAPVLKKEKVS